MTKSRDLANAATALNAVTATEIGYVDGVTSAIQTQLNAKQAVVSGVNDTEIGYLDGVTSAIQTQLDAKTAKSTLSTTGDIYYASSANTPARLGIGSTGNVLTVASGIPSWAAPATPAGGYTLINTGGTTLSGATTTISSIPTTYRMLKIVTVNFGINAAGYAGIEANGDATLFYGKEHVSVAAGGFGTQVQNGGIIQFSGFQDMKANATASNQAITEITNYASSTQNKQVTHFGTFISSSSDNNCTVMWFGELRTSSQITSLEFFTNQSFNAGTVYVYGA